jgi:hypothetical protein
MVKHMPEKTGAKVRKATPRKQQLQALSEADRILQKALIYLVRKHGMFLVATDLKEENVDGSRRWVITVTLRYPTGHEGFVGDLLYDGKEFSFLTPAEVRRERINKIAADPERTRKWNEYRASTAQAGEG